MLCKLVAVLEGRFLIFALSNKICWTSGTINRSKYYAQPES